MLAAGAVAVDRLFAAPRFRAHPGLLAVLKPALFAWLLVGMILLLPVTLPVLPVEAYLRYQSHLPFEIPRSEQSHKGAALPQHYADELGWQEMVAAVARVYQSLPPEDRARAAILTSNYGEAGAIDFFGPKYGLPKAICPHQSYFLWGPRHYTGEIVIRVGEPIDSVRPSYASVVVAATLDNPYALPYETRPILLCRGLKTDLKTLWPALKKWV